MTEFDVSSDQTIATSAGDRAGAFRDILRPEDERDCRYAPEGGICADLGVAAANAEHEFRWKRALDVTLIVLSLPFLIPVALLVALLVRFASPGPILFSQERVGYLGRRFRCFKFRSMFADVATSAHREHLQHLLTADTPMMKMDSQGDSRIIPFGLFLRSSGLDELPQLLNVLRGEMSLIGPRPCLPYEYDNYLPWHKERFQTLPGLTGLWQVSGKNRTTFVQMIQLDIEYAKRRCLRLDCLILLKTIPALVTQMRETRERRRVLADSRPAGSVLSCPPLHAGSATDVAFDAFRSTGGAP
jgi:lipopolysaccharide/colanic/teichoic acid biosynthesis glycosyltransferase